MDLKTIQLRNGIEMPLVMMGTSLWEEKGDAALLQHRLTDAVTYGVSWKAIGFDTGRDYHNEPLLGEIFSRLMASGACKREDLFVTTKVGNSQQKLKNMEKQIDISLHDLKLDYVDLWMLHWPLPDYWLDNWAQVVEIYKKGKARAIGIANCRERHIEALKRSGLMMPHVFQVEYHPFRTIPLFREMCREQNIQLEAYSANCLMLPFVRENGTLNRIAAAHGKSVTQIVMRWHVQQGVVPIFRSFNPAHIKENLSVFDFALTEDEMSEIFALNIDYKFHPESLNCPGY